MIKQFILMAGLSILLTACGGGETTTTTDLTLPSSPLASLPVNVTTDSGKIVSGFSCGSAGTIGSIAYRFTYQGISFQDGTAFVSCGVSDNHAEASHAQMWMPGTTGATNKLCIVTMDASGASTSGWWSFIENPKQAKYNDTGDVNDGNGVNFSASDCTIY